ncbi:hypothetical protein V6N12_046021 [Hibiscus sabdariffa]|uniref:Uncharacterized protein n=1 Tax=Hibiscus sabdariffa TaxID=183260 RepID=A0ABR2G4W6_9ROSI
MHCFNNLPCQDDKGDASAETTGPARADNLGRYFRIRQSVFFVTGLSLSPNNYLSCLYLILLSEESVTFL